MTEQERFEAWNKSCEWFREYHGNSTEEDILNFDEENKCYHYSTQQKCWEAWQAAQQKEGYVLVPVEPTYQIFNAISDGICDDTPTEQIWADILKAAQEAE